MTLTVELPREAELRLKQEAALMGLSINELAAQKLMQQLQSDISIAPKELGASYSLLKGSVLSYDDPFEPAIIPSDWEAADEKILAYPHVSLVV